jgi:polar amino acid transport system substrate-binding protein
LVLAFAAVLLLAGCTAEPTPARKAVASPPAAGPASSAPTDTSCHPRESLRPADTPPARGHIPMTGTLGKIQKRGRLILGTSQSTLLFSYRNAFTGNLEGFDIDMGRQIAQAIFGDPDKIQIKVIGNDQRVPLAKSGAVDLVAYTMTMNCARWKSVNFSTVYYDAGQRVLVSTASTAKGINDLGGKKVCAAAGSTSLENIAKVPAKPIPVSRPTFADCLVAFQLNEVDAISTDDTILAGLAAQDPYVKVVGPRFTDEPYGMAMPKDDDFTRFVNAVLEKNRANGTWTVTYKKWLGRFGPPPAPPAPEYRP